ncbi:type VI secretion lipoprotein [Escherichia coli]|uniref:Type VI secretion lipoprotein n=1 Tax=Escherichia coli TaxID=562 RepID=A0A376L090_ECOLX|nr:type VI secretion lipoprotein [Escherichia coli]
MCWGKNYIDHQDFNLLPDTIKTLPPVKLDEKTQFIGVVAYFSDDQATEWETNRDGGRNRPPLPPAGACTSKQHRNEKRG